jgi:glyoxylase-like metal-dependent hydrolase (beta-lactamase superfamily II)
MVEKITDNLYRIPVPLPKNPLRELNSYFIRGTDNDLLIDLGFRLPECRDALTAGLAELGSKPERRDVLLTHLHGDHSGLAGDFVGPGRHVFISETDKGYFRKIFSGEIRKPLHSRFKSEGFPEELLTLIESTNPAFVNSLESLDTRFRGLRDGEILTVGDYKLRTILVPGHTPGHAMFWMEEQKIMFTGDHVLFDITPNITFWIGAEDSLGDYLNSLEMSRQYPAELALPGHRKPGDYRERIEKLLAHHERRADQALGIIRANPGFSAYEIASHMTWKIRAADWDTFPPIQKWFAVGECISHLDYLRIRGKINRDSANGVFLYFSDGSSV